MSLKCRAMTYVEHGHDCGALGAAGASRFRYTALLVYMPNISEALGGLSNSLFSLSHIGVFMDLERAP